jgi:hypothetical protein
VRASCLSHLAVPCLVLSDVFLSAPLVVAQLVSLAHPGLVNLVASVVGVAAVATYIASSEQGFAMTNTGWPCTG